MIADFQKEGFVSVWLGNFENLEEFMDYTDFVFDEEGEAIGQFASHSALEWFDHDFVEANFVGSSFNTRRCLCMHSYSASFADTVAQALERARHPEDNSLFLLYDCAYDPTLVEVSLACRLRFVGYFAYVKGAPTLQEKEDELH